MVDFSPVRISLPPCGRPDLLPPLFQSLLPFLTKGLVGDLRTFPPFCLTTLEEVGVCGRFPRQQIRTPPSIASVSSSVPATPTCQAARFFSFGPYAFTVRFSAPGLLFPTRSWRFVGATPRLDIPECFFRFLAVRRINSPIIRCRHIDTSVIAFVRVDVVFQSWLQSRAPPSRTSTSLVMTRTYAAIRPHQISTSVLWCRVAAFFREPE